MRSLGGMQYVSNTIFRAWPLFTSGGSHHAFDHCLRRVARPGAAQGDASDGRLVATNDKSKDRTKFIGIGAGAGLLIGALTKQNTLASIFLGAGAGYAANELGNKKPSDVSLKAGTEFGVRLDRQFTFDTT